MKVGDRSERPHVPWRTAMENLVWERGDLGLAVKQPSLSVTIDLYQRAVLWTWLSRTVVLFVVLVDRGVVIWRTTSAYWCLPRWSTSTRLWWVEFAQWRWHLATSSNLAAQADLDSLTSDELTSGKNNNNTDGQKDTLPVANLAMHSIAL